MRSSVALIWALLIACQAEKPPTRHTRNDSVMGTNPSFIVTIGENYNRLFDRKNGWTGGDVASSLRLNDGRVLWLFGDSWLGSIREGRHVNSELVNNTIGIQTGLDPATAHVEFFHGTNAGKPAAFLRPADGNGWFWLSHGGIQTENGLYLFLSQIVSRTEDKWVWGFQVIGLSMAKIANPLDDPKKWRIVQSKVPWVFFDSAGNEKTFGIPLLREGNFVYLYGLEKEAATHDRYLLAARAPASLLEDFSTWEFYADNHWQSDFRKASRLCNHMGAELSVSYLPRFQRYVLVNTENGLSPNIQMRFASSPVGPWSAPTTIYRTPETDWDSTYFCYAAKAHPELTQRDDELIISYVCNSTDFGKLVADSRIYFPKFLRVRFTSTL